MLQDYFEGLTDNRQAGKVKHDLLEIVVMTIGYDSFIGQDTDDEFAKFLCLTDIGGIRHRNLLAGFGVKKA